MRNGKWELFIEELKKGITKRAYKRILDSYEYYILTKDNQYNEVPYLNNKKVNFFDFKQLNDYRTRYDKLYSLLNVLKEPQQDESSDDDDEQFSQPPYTQEYTDESTHIEDECEANDSVLTQECLTPKPSTQESSFDRQKSK